MGVWKPDRNGSIWEMAPCSRKRSTNSSTAAEGPQIIDWLGALSCESTTCVCSRRASSTRLAGRADHREDHARHAQRVRVEIGEEGVDLILRVDSGGGHGGPFAEAVPGQCVWYDVHALQRGVQEAAELENAGALAADVADRGIGAGR